MSNVSRSLHQDLDIALCCVQAVVNRVDCPRVALHILFENVHPEDEPVLLRLQGRRVIWLLVFRLIVLAQSISATAFAFTYLAQSLLGNLSCIRIVGRPPALLSSLSTPLDSKLVA